MLSSSRRLCSLRTAGQRGDPPLPARRKPGSADPDGERQPGAGDEHLRGGVRLSGRAFLAHDPGEQRKRLGVLKDVQIDKPGADQVWSPVARGHKNRARRAARQQRPDLGSVLRVVQQDQHTAIGQPGPVERGPLIVARRDLVAIHAQIPQEPGQHLPGVRRLRARTEQVNVELPVRELRADPVRRMHRERGLAKASAPFTTAMRTAPVLTSASPPVSREHRCATCVSRPVKSPISAGSCAGHGKPPEEMGPAPGPDEPAAAASPAGMDCARVPIAIVPGGSARDRLAAAPSLASSLAPATAARAAAAPGPAAASSCPSCSGRSGRVRPVRPCLHTHGASVLDRAHRARPPHGQR